MSLFCFASVKLFVLVFLIDSLINFSNSSQVYIAPFTLKTPGDPEISQPDAEYDPELGQSDPIICQVCGKLTDFRVILDPEWNFDPKGPFPGSGLTRVSLEC